MVRALQRPRAAHERARCSRVARKLADRVPRHARDPRRPFRVFRHAVVQPEQVAAETLEAGAVARDECRIVTALGEKRMRHGQHQRGIGIGANGQPLRVEKVRRIRLERTDGDELDAGLFRAPQPHVHAMGAAAAERHLAVLAGKSAERQDQARVLDD